MGDGHERDLPVPLADGTVGFADRWSGGPGRRPVVLVRSPYGRRFPWSLLYAVPFTRAGLHVVIASVRGTSGRGDAPAQPFTCEAADGAATVAWLRRQPWFDGRLATIGLSYLGYAAWALAADPPPELRAVVAQVAPHDLGPTVWPGGAFSLADSLGWAQLVAGPGRQVGIAAALGARGRRRRLEGALRPGAGGGPAGGRPLRDAATALTGRPVPWWPGWVANPPPSPHWTAYDQGRALDAVRVPVLVQAGWHDLFRRAGIEQHGALTARGVPVALTVGDFTHRGVVTRWWPLIREATAFVGEALEGAVPAGVGTVRTAVVGGRRRRVWPSWPPPGSTGRPLVLGPAGTLTAPASGGPRWSPPPVGDHRRAFHLPATSPPAPAAAALATFRFDPAHPTPSVGGPVLGPDAGPARQEALEARADVAVFTGPPLPCALEVAGTVRATVEVDADGPHHVVVRCCDVDRRGRSRHVCDGVVVAPAGRAVVEVDLGPIAARWRAGHRVRVQVAGGAHPRFAAHPGTDEPLADATTGRPVVVRVLGGRLTLPALDGAGIGAGSGGDTGDGGERT
ncbi:MAG TPA: CocE/NonD family hydrolase [Acidimicrobiales bacterium]|nr:CocE/NonD family hydrolase [Acidimicrobiales bacterium]